MNVKNIRKIKEDFENGAIPKAEYIDAMYQNHDRLFEYADFIRDTDISKIEITDGSLIMTSRSAGIRMLCAEGDKRIAPIEILNFGSYEKNELDFILKLLDDNYTVLDVGANFGWYSLYIAKFFPNSKVYAFEPIPHTFSYLRKNIALNESSNIIINDFGFSDENKEIPFYYYPGGSVNASAANLTNADSVQKITGTVKKMDDYVEDNKLELDFIKCDIEGAELLAFRGGLNVITKFKPIIFTEMLRKWSEKFNYHPNDIIKFFADIGYDCYVNEGDFLKLFARMDDLTKETNFFFLHRDKHKEKIKRFVR